MNKEDLNSLLDSIYELEGLVHLALNRDDFPEALPELITRKGREIAALASGLAGGSGNGLAVQEIHGVEMVVENPVMDNEPEPVVADHEPVVCDPDPVPVQKIPDAAVPEETRADAEPRGRLVFSINDRYRFKKELFNNSDADFNNTLALVASMEGYDEAEDYFVGELQWDQKKSEVADFLEILKKYFKE